MKKQVNKYFCDFCGTDQDSAEAMIVADNDSAICDKYTEKSMEIVQHHRGKARLAKDTDTNLR